MNATAPVITVRLDGHDRPVPAGTTLAALALALGHEPQAVATAVNGGFVPRHARDSCLLRSGDAVLFFHPIVGG